MIVAYLPLRRLGRRGHALSAAAADSGDGDVRAARRRRVLRDRATTSGRQLEAGRDVASATIATVVFLMIQVRSRDQTFAADGLGSQGLFTAILVAMVCVRVQKLFTDWNLVIRMPASVPPIVYESFLSLVPLFLLVLVFLAGPLRARAWTSTWPCSRRLSRWCSR